MGNRHPYDAVSDNPVVVLKLFSDFGNATDNKN